MATKGRTGAGKNKRKPTPFNGYVRHNLSKAEKNAYESWITDKTLEDLFSLWEQMVDNFYKVSVKHDNYGGGVQASFTCDSPDTPDYGWVMTARAPDVYNAIMLGLFKHYELFGGDWIEYTSGEDAGDVWG